MPQATAALVEFRLVARRP